MITILYICILKKILLSEQITYVCSKHFVDTCQVYLNTLHLALLPEKNLYSTANWAYCLKLLVIAVTQGVTRWEKDDNGTKIILKDLNYIEV